MESITRFITQQLKLKVNEGKSAVARPRERKFLGFSSTAGPEVRRVIAPKALDRFRRRIREITRRAKGVSMETTMEELAPYMRGWRSYFGFCETPEVLIGLTRWVRRRAGWLRKQKLCRWGPRVQAGRRPLLDRIGIAAALVVVGRAEEQIPLRVEHHRHHSRAAGDGHVAHDALHRVGRAFAVRRCRGGCGKRRVRSVHIRNLHNHGVVGDPDVKVVRDVYCDTVRVADLPLKGRRSALRGKQTHIF